MQQVSHVDWQGLATFLAALGSFITVLGTVLIQVLNYRKSDQNGMKLDSIHEKVNGSTQKLLGIVEKAALNPPKTETQNQ